MLYFVIMSRDSTQASALIFIVILQCYKEGRFFVLNFGSEQI